MKIYSSHGINDFIVCCGYKGYIIKEYFANYFLHMSNVTIDIANNSIEVHEQKVEPWKITLVDTGENTQTGGRLKKIKSFLGEDDFFMTYGDGLSSVNIAASLDFHKKHGKLVTMTAVSPPARFGALEIVGTSVISFKEKPHGNQGLINGGFFIINPKALDLIDSDNTFWEKEPLESLAIEGQLQAYLHSGFWHPMDTLRDKNYLDSLWTNGSAPWKKW